MSWLGDLINFRFSWRADDREERTDARPGRSELIQLADQQIDNAERALQLCKADDQRDALSDTLRRYRARKDSILEAQIQFHPAMLTGEPTAAGAAPAPLSRSLLPLSDASDAADEVFAIGMALGEEQQWLAAAVAFHRVQQIEPQRSDSFYNRGTCLAHAGQNENALADFDRSVELRPDDAVTHYNRGYVLFNLGRLKEAVAAYDGSLELRPDDAATHTGRGVVFRLLGQYEAALADYDRSLELRGDDLNVIYIRGTVLSLLGRSEEALLAADRQPAPTLPGTYYNHACLLAVLGRAGEALESLRRAIHAAPEDRGQARTDPDFANIRDDPRFRKLVGEGEPAG